MQNKHQLRPGKTMHLLEMRDSVFRLLLPVKASADITAEEKKMQQYLHSLNPAPELLP